MAYNVVRVQDTINAMLQSMISSRDPWDLPGSQCNWSQQGSANQIGRGLIGLQSCLGEVEGIWFGTPPALTPLPHSTGTWLPEWWGQWRFLQKRGKIHWAVLSLVTLYPWQSRPLVRLDQRFRTFSMSLVADSKKSRERPSPTSISYKEYWLQFNG